MHSEDTRSLRFAADRMLGKLVRWLRLFGYDTFYQRDATTGNLVYIALRDNRVLLTRQRKVCELINSPCYLIHSSKLGEQIRELVRKFAISTEITYSRCTLCNSPIRSVKKQFVKDKVPIYTYITHENFYICPTCKRIYWKGSHCKRAKASLRRFLGSEDT